MQHDHITSVEHLKRFCDQISNASLIGFDTEFVAEDTYLPELCLLQVAAGDRLAVVDTLAIDDLSPFWDLLVSPGHETIVHAGREEFRFCQLATGRRPANLFDVQLAAGLNGLEYPAAYGTLISKLLGKVLPKGETRTNWRRRPLSEPQIQYALQDVVDLQTLYGRLRDQLDKQNRLSWLEDEMTVWQDGMESAENAERWRRVSGVSGLSSRCLAIVRELWKWRDQEARTRNQPAKRVLRDDLIVELAKRKSADIRRISAVRGLERQRLQKHLPTIARSIQVALDLADNSCPRPVRKSSQPQLTLLGQFLSTALSSICRAARVAPSVVSNPA